MILWHDIVVSVVRKHRSHQKHCGGMGCAVVQQVVCYQKVVANGTSLQCTDLSIYTTL